MISRRDPITGRKTYFYVCKRCGIERRTENTGRPIPQICQDCKWTLAPAERNIWMAAS